MQLGQTLQGGQTPHTVTDRQRMRHEAWRYADGSITGQIPICLGIYLGTHLQWCSPPAHSHISCCPFTCNQTRHLQEGPDAAASFRCEHGHAQVLQPQGLAHSACPDNCRRCSPIQPQAGAKTQPAQVQLAVVPSCSKATSNSGVYN